MSPVRKDIQNMGGDDVLDIDDFFTFELETNKKIREYIAEKMSIALASAKDKGKALRNIQGFLSGEIATLSGDTFSATVDDMATHEFAESHKHDLAMMLRCCEAELRNMASTGVVAAPYYFVRAANNLGEKTAELCAGSQDLPVVGCGIPHLCSGPQRKLSETAAEYPCRFWLRKYRKTFARGESQAEATQLKAEAKQKKLRERR